MIGKAKSPSAALNTAAVAVTVIAGALAAYYYWHQTKLVKMEIERHNRLEK